MDLVEVDPDGAEAAKAVLHLGDDPATRVAPLVALVTHRAVDLGGQDDLVALAAGKRLAHDLFRLAPRVHVGGVDEVDPGVQRTVDDPDRLVVIGVAPGPEHHCPQAKWADLHSGASEGALLHEAKSTLRRPGGVSGPGSTRLASWGRGAAP